MRITSKYQELEKKGKIIQLIQFLAWLTRLCLFRLVQCQVQRKDRLTMAIQQPRAKILTLMLGFEIAILIL